MAVDSYLELFTTLYGLYVYEMIWNVLLDTGIAFIPFLLILVSSFIEARENEEREDLAAGLLRLLEVRFIVAALVIFLFVHPSITLDAASITYTPKLIEGRPGDTGTSAAPEEELGDDGSPVTFGSLSFQERPISVRVAPVTHLFLTVVGALNRTLIEGLPTTADLRFIANELSNLQITDKELKSEFLRFNRDCFLAAKDKYIKNPPDSDNVNDILEEYGTEELYYMGSRVYLTEPGFYGEMSSIDPIRGFKFDEERDFHIWEDAADAEETEEPEWGRPTCKQWWAGIAGENDGIRQRVFRDLEQNLTIDLGDVDVSDFEEEDWPDQYIKFFVLKEPPTIETRGYDFGYANVLTTIANGKIERFIRDMFSTWLEFKHLITTEIRMQKVLDTGPILQAIFYFMFFSVLPIFFLFSRYSFVHTLTLFSTYFFVKFLTVIWFLCWFIDQQVISALYPSLNSWLLAMHSSPGKHMMLNTITALMYLGFPIAFFIILSSIGNQSALAMSRLLPNVGKVRANFGKLKGNKDQGSKGNK